MGKIAPGKKRYFLTLTESKVQAFKEKADSLGLPDSILSRIVEQELDHYMKVLDETGKSISEVAKRISKERKEDAQ